MAWTKYQLFLAGLMLVTGSINTLSAKWADSFKHPFVQAVGMFLGEFSCLAAFYLLKCQGRRQSASSVEPQQPFNTLLFLPPALCDMTGTSIMYVALNMTSASSFQMLRGAVIIFTGLFSVAFLDRRLAPSQWLGILITIAGLVVVGLADLLSKHDSQHKLSEVITGDLLIIAFTLALGWEIFYPLQILGFLILLMGTALYNGLHRPLLAFLSRRWRLPTQEGEQERLLGDSRTPINEAS